MARITLGLMALLLLTAVPLAPPFTPSAEAALQGQSRTLIYLDGFDHPDSLASRTRAVQYLRLDLRSEGHPHWGAHVYASARGDLRDRPSSTSAVRMYHAYLEWNPKAGGGGAPLAGLSWLRAGRQFVSAGAGSAAIDGVSARAQFARRTGVTVFAGTLGSQDRDGVHVDAVSHSLRFGAQAVDRHLPGWDIGASYVQERRDGNLARSVIGGHARGELARLGSIYADASNDLAIASSARLWIGASTRSWRGWSGWGEYSHRGTSLPATSFFSVFETHPIDKERIQIARAFGRSFSATVGYEASTVRRSPGRDEVTHRVRLGPSTKWGSMGLLWSHGSGLHQTSVYSRARVPVRRDLDATVMFNYFDYEFGPGPTRDGNAVTGAAGLDYSPRGPLGLSARVETLKNRVSEYELRFLGEVRWRFFVGDDR